MSDYKMQPCKIQLDPIDWKQLYIQAKLSPGQRIVAMSQTSAFNRSLLRGAFQRKFPNRSLPEINMLMLAYLSQIPEYHYE